MNKTIAVRPKANTRRTTGTQTRETKLQRREWKFLDEAQGIFEGYLAVFGNVDDDSDLIMAGAFKKTLQEHEAKRRVMQTPYLFPFLWNHHDDEPIGGCLEAYEDDIGLFVKCQLDMNVQRAREIWSGLKNAYIGTMSIGYDVIRRQIKGTVRVLLELRLWEGSVVTFPANHLAIVDPRSVKSATDFTGWQLGSRTLPWNNNQARKRIETWAAGDPARLAKVHFWQDATPAADPKDIGSYKFLFADVIADRVRAMPRAIFASAAMLSKAKIPSGDVPGVQAKLEAYYTKMAGTWNDDSIVTPWKKEKSMSRRTRKPEVKAVDLAGALSRQTDDLQQQWADLWRAFVYAIATQMWDYDITDKAEAVATVVEDFGAELETLVKASQAASFTPSLDDDTDSFADPSDDQPMETMSHGAPIQTKKGAAISAANKAIMGQHLDAIDGAHATIKKSTKAMRDAFMVAIGDPQNTDPAGNDDPQDRTDGPRSTAGKSHKSSSDSTDDTDAEIAAFRAYMGSQKSAFRTLA